MGMLAELSIVPLGAGDHLSEPLAVALRIIDGSGIRYALTPSGTCLEGDWDDIVAVAKRCHEAMRRRSRHVFTTLRIEDHEGAVDMLRRNVRSVESRVGRPLENFARPGATP